MNIVERLNKLYGSMTRKQMELADFILADPNLMCFITLKELCAATKISEVTILNACTAWGYSNYNDLKNAFRKYMSEYGKQLVESENAYSPPRMPKSELSDKSRYLMNICHAESEDINTLSAGFNPDEYLEAARMILSHDNIIICGRGISYQIAEFISMRLATVGIPSVKVNTELNDSIHVALPLVKKKTLLISIAFPDYFFVTNKFTEYAVMKKASILAITDSTSAEIAKNSTLTLITPSATRMFPNTLSSPMMLANLLTSAVSIELDAGRRKKRTASDEYSSLFSDNEKETNDTNE